MASAFSDKSIRVLILESLSARRAQYSDALREYGIKNITGAASIEDGLAMAKDQPFDWVFTPVVSTKGTQAHEFLLLALREEKYRQMRVSYLVKDEDPAYLEYAFSLGLLSYHRREQTGTELTQDIGQFFSLCKTTEWRLPLVASHYLRKHLTASGKIVEAADFQKILANVYPEDADLLLRLGEDQLTAGKRKDGIQTLDRVRSLAPHYTAKIESLLELHPEQNKAAEQTFAASRGINTALVVDSDEAARNAVKDVLTSLGTKKVVAFIDGQEAWAWLESHPEPDLIIHEWRLPYVTGSILVQRIRMKGFHKAPIIVHSSLVKMSDKMLLQEMGVNDVIEKPASKRILTEALKASIDRETQPKDPDGMVARARKLLESHKSVEARKLLTNLQKKHPEAQAKWAELEAEILFAEGRFPQARKVAVAAFQDLGESIFLLNTLAKVHIRLGEHERALKFLERANAVNPQNIARLCSMAEISSMHGDMPAAEKALRAAKGLDEANPMVTETAVKVALSTGDMDSARHLGERLPSHDGVVAYLNNSAVVLSGKGEIGEAIKLYERGLASLTDKKNKNMPTLEYNLALAFARDGKVQDARKHLATVVDFGESIVLSRAQSLLKRIDSSLQTGAKLELHLTKSVEEPLDLEEEHLGDTELSWETPQITGIQAGDVALYKVYKPSRD